MLPSLKKKEKKSRFWFRLLLQQEIRWFASLLMLQFHKGDFQDLNEHWSKCQASKESLTLPAPPPTRY